VELTRDKDLLDALKGLPFRNEKASQSAFKELVDELVQDDDGNWRHKSGASIRDAVKAYQKDEDNAYLFKVKASTGTGDNQKKPSEVDNKGKSLFEMSQAEVLKLAAEGKLPRR